VVKLLGSEGRKTLFVCPKSAIKIGERVFEPNEIRLLRRIVRDKNFRDTNANFTMSLWESVRRNEENNIFPNVGENCVIVDTTQAYEINILKPYLLTDLEIITPDSKHYETRMQIEEKLRGIGDADSAFIGKNSLYKEFV
jgi:uridine kinase